VRKIVIQQYIQLPTIIAGLFVLMLYPAANAEEGGSGHYAVGCMATMIDLAPTDPGWLVQPLYLHYDGKASGSRVLSIAGVIAGDIDAEIDALTLGGLYTFEQPVMGAHYSVGVYLPYMWVDVTASLTVDGTVSSRTDSVSVVVNCFRTLC